MGKKIEYRFTGRLWIEAGGRPFVGEGKAELLRRTAELGSLRKAALDLGLSYRKAWYSMNMMNKLTGKPLIMLQRGGINGGTAKITQHGQKTLELFEQGRQEFEQFMKSQNRLLNDMLL
jgi:molybdate transport system regulatory protein